MWSLEATDHCLQLPTGNHYNSTTYLLLKTMRTTSAIIAIFLRLGVPGNCDDVGHRYDRDPVPAEQWVGRMAQWRWVISSKQSAGHVVLFTGSWRRLKQLICLSPRSVGRQAVYVAVSLPHLSPTPLATHTNKLVHKSSSNQLRQSFDT